MAPAQNTGLLWHAPGERVAPGAGECSTMPTLFPALAQPTAELPDVTVPDESPHHNATMPTRRQTRDQDRHDRITQERCERHNLNRQTQREQRKRRKWVAENYEPPPF
jgi:hypothetical protein